jgi:hypothetical protein
MQKVVLEFGNRKPPVCGVREVSGMEGGNGGEDRSAHEGEVGERGARGGGVDWGGIETKAKWFVTNERMLWPSGYSRFYWGQVPDISSILGDRIRFKTQIQKQKVFVGIHADWHREGMRLAARMMGEAARKAAQDAGVMKRRW